MPQHQGMKLDFHFWIDELQFEKLGTIAQPQPAILKEKMSLCLALQV